MLKPFRHGVVDKLICDSLFGLVFVACLGREVRGNENEAFLNIRIGNL